MKKRIVIVSICVGLILAGLTFIYFNNPNEGMGLIPCPIYLFTKLYCPGCGTGRAIYSLMHLEFFQAFRYNPLCVILLPFIIAYVVMVGLSYIKFGHDYISRHLPFKIVFAVLILVLLYGVARNIPLPFFELLRPTTINF